MKEDKTDIRKQRVEEEQIKFIFFTNQKKEKDNERQYAKMAQDGKKELRYWTKTRRRKKKRVKVKCNGKFFFTNVKEREREKNKDSEQKRFKKVRETSRYWRKTKRK